ncbi:sigma-54 interaction domain-containing protein [Dissulfurimicrobium hydrothermale]|uniref:sigma-54 interaction domain-containing protein n=1 Tax=Dissulfurimicrobium hydrothermale TaxID=1750598 RepID=UPI001EDA792E|nr:sigma-54 dependent transcriptional regulator [Dissulfurimicrobium hydrothermale]UKL14114.1 sigma-54 dependent transcriptional regulator [Dissulfurimicrobium hydrothermale]
MSLLSNPQKTSEDAFSVGPSMRLLVVGPGRQCATLLETLSNIQGCMLVGLLDIDADPSSLELARRLDISLWNECAQLRRLPPPDIVLFVDQGQKDCLATFGSEGTTILHGTAVRLVQLLVRECQRIWDFETKYKVTKREYDLYIQQGGPIIGKSRQIEMVREMIAQVAPTPTTVLLLGETGTGKDLVARSIHQASHLQDQPFITVNCTALTSTLIESELFGYVKGAFTGAEKDCKGLLEEAHNGTVFLDEIGDMKMELQAKMLRFLQTGEIRPVGSSLTKRVKVRVIAATNRNLEEAIKQGDFRQDLFYRLNTFTIVLPSLRHRTEDIPYLAYQFLTKAEHRLNKKINGISDEALEVLMNYDWPGNVRELENVIERAVIVCTDGIINPGHLAIPIPQSMKNHPPAGGEGKLPKLKTSRDRFLADYERQEILHYLKKAEGNVSQASRLSGIPRRTLYRLIKKHGITRPVPDQTR